MPGTSSRPPRRFSLYKLALAGIAGLAIALAISQRPLTAPLPDTIEIADMTWVEVRSAIARGYTTVIVPSGGIEQNGPHMILGKHDLIVRYAAGRIAAQLGKTLVTPVIPFVPEGGYDPPQGHLRFPGTIGVSEQVFAGVLDGIARSLKAGGFKTICFIADHGGSLKPQAEVAARLSKEWAQQGVRVFDVSDYYADEGQTDFLTGEGETPASIGQHAGITDTSELMAVHPQGVDLGRFADAPFTLESNGVSGDPMRASAERGRALIDIKIQAAVRQIKAQWD
ncbi:MAG TPA: creatininase family protein [Xanthobacteraceae bacterium]|jgi:creatinine amidohydrolase|nr:creatininase family protein [Xanthobacteraceae bacterium]